MSDILNFVEVIFSNFLKIKKAKKTQALSIDCSRMEYTSTN